MSDTVANVERLLKAYADFTHGMGSKCSKPLAVPVGTPEEDKPAMLASCALRIVAEMLHCAWMPSTNDQISAGDLVDEALTILMTQNEQLRNNRDSLAAESLQHAATMAIREGTGDPAGQEAADDAFHRYTYTEDEVPPSCYGYSHYENNPGEERLRSGQRPSRTTPPGPIALAGADWGPNGYGSYFRT